MGKANIVYELVDILQADVEKFYDVIYKDDEEVSNREKFIRCKDILRKHFYMNLCKEGNPDSTLMNAYFILYHFYEDGANFYRNKVKEIMEEASEDD